MNAIWPLELAGKRAVGWSRVEIVPDGARFSVVGVSRCGRRWPAATGQVRADARRKGRETAEALGVPLVDAVDNAARTTDSGLKTFRWGG